MKWQGTVDKIQEGYFIATLKNIHGIEDIANIYLEDIDKKYHSLIKENNIVEIEIPEMFKGNKRKAVGLKSNIIIKPNIYKEDVK
jgi:hypothetical protein